MAGTITHKWYGTTLAVTSDSGTSMCDLKGAQGDMGIRGPQGRPGVILSEDGSVDMTGYATETYVDEKIATINADVDLNDYYTKAETASLVISELIPYATEAYVDEKVADVDVDLSDYYTKAETDTAIQEGLTDYATKTYVDTAVDSVDFTGYATETYVNEQIANADLDVDLSDYYTKEEVNVEIAKAQLEGSDVNLSAYYTKSETDAAIQTAVDDVDLTNYYTKTETNSAITNGLKGYATTAYVDEAVGDVDLTGYATEAYVNNAISNVVVEETQPNWSTQDSTSPSYIKNKPPIYEGVGDYSIMGWGTSQTQGKYACAIGYGCEANGYASHAENAASANGDYSHAEGRFTSATGAYSHVEGYYNVAASTYQHVQGKHCITDNQNRYAHIVGNGTYDEASNAHTLDWNGNAWFKGDVYIGGTSMDNAVKLGPDGASIDLSSYYTKTEIDELLGVIENGSY